MNGSFIFSDDAMIFVAKTPKKVYEKYEKIFKNCQKSSSKSNEPVAHVI